MQISSSQQQRIQSIDFLRGAVMIIMAIDHVRVYSGLPAGGIAAGIFFTRWITHFCAPAFAFFAGTSAFLLYQKTGDRQQLTRFLVTRGLLLVLLELVVIRFFWMFNFDFGNFTFTGVIWMLGWCMVILPLFLRLSPAVVGLVGVLIILSQQVFSYVPEIFPWAWRETVIKFWAFFYPASMESMAGAGNLSGIGGTPKVFGFSIFYVIIPWIGVMMAGYGIGPLFLRGKESSKIFIRIGLACTVLFLVAGTVMVWISPPQEGMPFLFRLLGQQKYPPSQLYLLMTLGPVIALVPWSEKVRGPLANVVISIGKVPMFYYLLHILLIHLSAFVVNLITTGATQQDWYTYAPFVSVPEEQRWGLPLLYLVWLTDVVILYFACSWYVRYKADHQEMKWLKYV